MSRASKLTLAATGLGTVGIISFVHWAQERERAVCVELDFAYRYANMVALGNAQRC